MSLLKFAGAVLFAAFVSVEAADLAGKCPNGQDPPICLVDACAQTVCAADSVCVRNFCDGFPTAGKAACTATCLSLPGAGACPHGSGAGQCSINPCATARCKANQKCVADCNGCRATCVARFTCPDGSSPAQCLVDPCASVTCATGTECVANYCSDFPTAGNGACSAACVARPNTAN